MKLSKPASIQATLPVGRTDYATFENYHSDDSHQTVSLLKQFLEGGIGCNTCYLWGPSGAGKTHLLYAACQLISNSAYIPLKDLSLQPDVLDRLEEFRLVCIDDIQCIAAQSVWENNLIALLENLENQKNLFIVSANFPPQELGFDLQDLVNRFSGRQILRLHPTSEETLVRILTDRAARRGLSIDDSVIRFILERYSRDTHSLIRLLDRIDRLSLEKRRRITIPFLKQLDEFRN